MSGEHYNPKLETNKTRALKLVRSIIRVNDYFDFHLPPDETRNLMKSQANSVEYKFKH